MLQKYNSIKLFLNIKPKMIKKTNENDKNSAFIINNNNKNKE